MALPIDPTIRFWEKVRPGGQGECWHWGAGRSGDGYGAIKVYGRQMAAHRFSYILHFGEIPESAFVCHTCDNPRCVNPHHLWLGSAESNAVDMVQKDRQKKGLDVNTSKLSEDDIREIRRRYQTENILQRELGEIFGVNQPAISCIVRRATWKHLY